MASKPDRHARSGHYARLDEDDDAWLRAYAEHTGQPVRQVIIRALREFRERAEGGNAQTQREELVAR